MGGGGDCDPLRIRGQAGRGGVFGGRVPLLRGSLLSWGAPPTLRPAVSVLVDWGSWGLVLGSWTFPGDGGEMVADSLCLCVLAELTMVEMVLVRIL